LSRERINLGKSGEDIAVDYLQNHGYRLITRNYRRKSGEIDIICLDGDTYVFIEVKTRKSSRYGHPLEAVTRAKQRQISFTALDYLTRHDLLDTPVRFDVIAIINDPLNIEVTHIKDAFDAC
jgi:putative endonuclease